MSSRLFHWLRTRLRRREWTANRADPTHVVQWRWGSRLTLTASWGVEAVITLWRFTWRSYDHPVMVWLYGGLEDAHAEHQAQFDDDPMGRIGDYV